MLIVQPEAEVDIAEAREWYETKQAGVGDELIEEVERVFDLISKRPDGFTIVHRQTRKAILRRFPYIVLYIEREQDVIILGVIHQRRNPSVMKSRFA